MSDVGSRSAITRLIEAVGHRSLSGAAQAMHAAPGSGDSVPNQVGYQVAPTNSRPE